MAVVRIQNFLLLFPVLLCFLVPSNVWGFERLTIDLEDDLVEFGSNAGCTYHMSSEEIDCKFESTPTTNSGFWSSCVPSNCELIINIGKIGKPTKLEVLSFVGGAATIRARYRLTPTGSVFNLNPIIERGPDWINNVFILNPNFAWNEESVLIVRLHSNPFWDDIDIVDKIVVEFETNEGTTEEPSVPPSEVPSDVPISTTSGFPSYPPTSQPPTTEETTRRPIDFDCPEAEGLFPDPNNCRGFYQCDAWIPNYFCCPDDLYFNDLIKRCDFNENVPCDNDPGSCPYP
jgi:hypothetical protein